MAARVSACAVLAILLGGFASPAGVGAASARASAEEAAGASAPEQGASPAPARPRALLDYCVSGGAPLVGAPVLDDRDRLYFATTDGYLHAFESDGRYRFSYTVQGAPLGSVSLRPGDGTILLGTTRRIIYAIGQKGALHWSFETVSPVWSGIAPLDAHNVAFLGLDGFLYALTTTGGARFRVKVPGKPLGELLVSRPGVVWVPLTDGLARLENAWRTSHISLPTAVETLLPAAQGVVARAGQLVVRYDDRGTELARYEADEVGAGGRGLVLVEGTRVRALTDTRSASEHSPDARKAHVSGGAQSASTLSSPPGEHSSDARSASERSSDANEASSSGASPREERTPKSSSDGGGGARPPGASGARSSPAGRQWILPEGARVSAPPAFEAPGVAIPLDDGHLALGSDDGSIELVEITRAPLGRPLFGASLRRIFVTSRDGQVCAVSWDAAPQR